MDQETLHGIVGLGVVLVALVVSLAIQAIICYLLMNCFKAIPSEFRLMEPGMVWLLLIPCFNLVWIFFVFPRLSKSFKTCFDSVQDTTVGDCGAALGLTYAILCVVSIIPYLGCLTGVAALVVLIIYLVKVTGLKNRIPQQQS